MQLFNRRKNHAGAAQKAFERQHQPSNRVAIREPQTSRTTLKQNERMTFTPERDRDLENEDAS